MKKLICSLPFVCLLLLQSCNRSNSYPDDPSSPSNLEIMKKDPDVLNYGRAVRTSFQNTVYNKYNTNNLDFSYVKKHSRSAKTFKQLCEIYENAGIVNAEAYLTETSQMFYLLGKIKTKYPIIKTMPKEDFIKLFDDGRSKDSANVITVKKYLASKPKD